MPLTITPERPVSVPGEAWWSHAEAAWELGPTNAADQRHGPYRYWREGGTLAYECHYELGKAHGPFKRFHESGEVASEGNLLAGELHGTRTWHASDRPTTEAGVGISVEVRRCETDYERGVVTAVRHFNGAGERVLANGKPFPARPPSVPPTADFASRDGRWQAGRLGSDGLRTGLWRFWTASGVLVEEVELAGGLRHGLARCFFDTGAPASEGCFDADKRTGVWRTWRADGSLESEAAFADDAYDGVVRTFDAAGGLDGERTYCRGLVDGPTRQPVLPGQLRDAAVRTLSGCMLAGKPAGTWLLADEGGRVVGRVDYGLPRPAAADYRASPAFSEVGRPAALWGIPQANLLAERRIGEALCAGARGAAESASAGDLALLLERHTLRRPAAEATALAASAVEQAEGDVLMLCDALVDGADPASVFAALAFTLLQESRRHAAVDFINAALLLAPLRRDLRYTRALAHISLGDPQGAAGDAELLASAQPREAAYLRAYVQALFPVFEFWPAHETMEGGAPGLAAPPVRELGEVRALIQKYATRLGLIRARLRELVPGEPRAWMPPDLTGLLPDGPVELKAWDLPSTVGDGDAPGVDERLVVDDDLATLQRAARAEWRALCWLCWSAGLDAVALPTALAQPAAFALAASVAAQRFWRCHDQHETAGETAAAHGVPGFVWEGMAVEAVPAELLFLPTTEYAELQAVFLWLAERTVESPWQSDLRGVDAAHKLTAALPTAARAAAPRAVVLYEVFLAETAPFAGGPPAEGDEGDGLRCRRVERAEAPERFVAAPFGLAPATPNHAFRQPQPTGGSVVAEAIKTATTCYVVTCEVDAPEDFGYLQDANALVERLLAHGPGVVVDRTSGVGYLAEQFLRVMGDMAIRDTVALVLDDSGPTTRVETRGMSKFGNQDFAMDEVPTDADTLEVARRWLYDNVCSLAAYRERVVSGETMSYSRKAPGAMLVFKTDDRGYLLISDCHAERKEPTASLAVFFSVTVPMFEATQRLQVAKAA